MSDTEIAELKARVRALEGESLGPVMGPMPHPQARSNALIDRLCNSDPTIGIRQSTLTTKEAKEAEAQSKARWAKVSRLERVKARRAYLQRMTHPLPKDLAEIASLERMEAELSE